MNVRLNMTVIVKTKEGAETTYVDVWSVGIEDNDIFLKDSTFADDIHLDRRTIDFLEILRNRKIYNHYGEEVCEQVEYKTNTSFSKENLCKKLKERL